MSPLPPSLIRPDSPSLRRRFLGLVALVCGLLLVVPIVRHPPDPKLVLDPMVMDEEARRHFFQSEIHPLLARARVENGLSADHARARLRATFAHYRTGILPLAEDLHSLRTGLGVARRRLTDALGRDGGTEALVREKFARHLFSPEGLLADLTAAVSDLHGEWEANRARMLADCRAAVARVDLPFDAALLSVDGVDRDARRHLETFVRGPGPSEAAQGSVRLLVSGLIDLTALRVSTGLAARLGGAATARAAATAGGATAGGAVGGASGGSALGPAGTLSGLALGLAAGVVADWWMSTSSTAELADELHQMLSEMEAHLLRDPEVGLELELRRTVNRLAVADEQALGRILIAGRSP